MGFVPEPRRHLTLQKAIPPTDGLQRYFEGPCPFRVDAVEKGLRTSPNSDSADSAGHELGGGDDGAAGRAMESVLSISAR